MANCLFHGGATMIFSTDPSRSGIPPYSVASTWFKDTTCDSALKLLLQRASWLLFTSHPTKVALGHQIAASAKRVPWPHMGSRTISPSRMSKLRAIAQASTWCMPWKGKDPPSIIWFCCRMGISSKMRLPSTWQWTVRSGDPGSAISTDKSIDQKKHPKMKIDPASKGTLLLCATYGIAMHCLHKVPQGTSK